MASAGDLAAGLSARGCEEVGGSAAAVVSLWSPGPGVPGRVAGGGSGWCWAVQEPTTETISPRVCTGRAGLSDRSSWWHAAWRSSTRRIQLLIFFYLHLSCRDSLDSEKDGFLSAFLNRTQEATILIISQL